LFNFGQNPQPEVVFTGARFTKVPKSNLGKLFA